MSGGMIKIGIFGICKVCFDLLGAAGGEVGWGVLVIVIGAVSSVLGVVYALGEHDLKSLLAYHSVENIGIILLGVGVGIYGWAADLPWLAAIGLLAGLYHLVNHAMFKGLLFLGAGSVLHATGTRNMEVLGGLAKVMPITAVCFLIGSLAISAIPPLNGFVSEWFTYQGLIGAAMDGGIFMRIVFAFAVVALAITGALAVTCFVKAFGVTFLARPRSEAAEHAHEVPAPMTIAMVILTVACIALGLGAAWGGARYQLHRELDARGAVSAGGRGRDTGVLGHGLGSLAAHHGRSYGRCHRPVRLGAQCRQSEGRHEERPEHVGVRL